jgi:phage terminase large subunit-like protein
VDLSSNVDLTAVSYMFIRDGFYYFYTDFYLPNASLKTRADKELYKQWKNSGDLKVTSGNVTDYDYITRDIKQAYNEFNVIAVRYDKYNATQWAIQCTDEGIPLEPFSQTIGNFNAATKEFERLMLKGMVCLDENPIMRFCLRNVEIRRDLNGNEKPNKVSDKKKIDGVIAALQALSVYMENPNIGNNSIY